MNTLRVSTTVEDINETYQEILNSTPPEGAGPAKGFVAESPDGTYVLSFYIKHDGTVDIQVRPPYGSYEAMEQPYNELVSPVTTEAVDLA